MSTFLEFYQRVQESRDDFYVGKILVSLAEVSSETYTLLAEASNTIPNRKSLQDLPNPASTKKWRVTYTINGHVVTNYLTAQDRHEAKRMLFDYLQGVGDNTVRSSIVRASEIEPVANWDELLRLLQYSMKYDRKRKGGQTEPFGSIDTGDFHLMLDLVRRHPDFVRKRLDSMPADQQNLKYYFKLAYNGLSKRDLDKDLDLTTSSHWKSKVNDLFNSYGKSIGKKLAGARTRNSPRAVPAEEPEIPPDSLHRIAGEELNPAARPREPQDVYQKRVQ